ncbi:MAG: inositol monophosphatase family protein [Dermatophilaceae bacterium]
MASVPDPPTGDGELAVTAAVRGMAEARLHVGDSGGRLIKDGDDVATAADLAVEQVIRDVLAAARPGDGIVGEELGAIRAGSRRTWLVDPLCGTRNFASSTPPYCVNVALRTDGAVTSAAVADPATGGVVWTDGETTFERTDGGADRPVAPSSASRIVELNADGPGDHVGPLLVADREFRRWMSPRVSASTMALAWVASGRRAAYISDGDLLDSVHFAAGIALCVAAGCEVTDLEGGPVATGRGLAISAERRTHVELLDHVASCLAGRIGSSAGSTS